MVTDVGRMQAEENLPSPQRSTWWRQWLSPCHLCDSDTREECRKRIHLTDWAKWHVPICHVNLTWLTLQVVTRSGHLQSSHYACMTILFLILFGPLHAWLEILLNVDCTLNWGSNSQSVWIRMCRSFAMWVEPFWFIVQPVHRSPPSPGIVI